MRVQSNILTISHKLIRMDLFIQSFSLSLPPSPDLSLSRHRSSVLCWLFHYNFGKTFCIRAQHARGFGPLFYELWVHCESDRVAPTKSEVIERVKAGVWFCSNSFQWHGYIYTLNRARLLVIISYFIAIGIGSSPFSQTIGPIKLRGFLGARKK